MLCGIFGAKEEAAVFSVETTFHSVGISATKSYLMVHVTQTAIITYDIIKDGFSQCESLPRLCHNYLNHITALCDACFRHELSLASDCLLAEVCVTELEPGCVNCGTLSLKCGDGRKNVTRTYVSGFENGVSAVGSEICAVRSM